MDPNLIPTVTAVSSVVIALAALFVAWRTAYVQRIHSKLSVLPHVDFIYGHTSTGSLALLLVNNGVGPAVLTEFSVSVDEETVASINQLALWPLVSASAKEPLLQSGNAPSVGQYISAGEKYLLLDAGSYVSAAPGTREALEVAQRYERALAKLTVRITYRSMYEQTFTSSWRLPSSPA